MAISIGVYVLAISKAAYVMAIQIGLYVLAISIVAYVMAIIIAADPMAISIVANEMADVNLFTFVPSESNRTISASSVPTTIVFPSREKQHGLAVCTRIFIT
jgi:hypothetical protein